MLSERIAVLGVGAMGSALVRGWLANGVLSAGQVTVFDLATERAAALAAELGVVTAATPAAAVAQAEVVLVAVKPGDVAAALRAAFGSNPASQPLLLSIAAGITLGALEAVMPELPIIRVMPNTPALVQAGASGFARGAKATEEHAALARTLLGAVGLAYEVKESLLNAVTGLSGSGPAYAYLAIEALADGGVKCGLPREVALALAAQTLLGAAKMVLETGDHPGLLKDRVCSPGGTTIAAVAALEAAGFRAALIEAVSVSARRAGELG